MSTIATIDRTREVVEKYLADQETFIRSDDRDIERLCYDLAKVSSAAFPQRTPNGGLVLYLPDGSGSVTVLRHPDGRVKVGRVSDFTPTSLLSDTDHWRRALKWSYAAARVLGNGEMIDDVGTRYASIKNLRTIADGCIRQAQLAFAEGQEDERPSLPGYSIAYSSAVVLKGKIGRHEGLRHGLPNSLLTIHPKARIKKTYLRYVIMHEAIHYVLGEQDIEHPHDEQFQSMAEAVGLPVVYRD